MQAIGILITGLIIGLVEFIGRYVAHKYAVLAVLVTSIITLTGALFLTLESLLSGISASLPSNALLLVTSFIPSNMSACVSVVLAARLIRMAYDMKLRFLQMAATK